MAGQYNRASLIFTARPGDGQLTVVPVDDDRITDDDIVGSVSVPWKRHKHRARRLACDGNSTRPFSLTSVGVGGAGVTATDGLDEHVAKLDCVDTESKRVG
jgi:hypothetical protein